MCWHAQPGRIGIGAGRNQTVEDYLPQWLAAQKLRLKPTTWIDYCDYTHNDLIPAHCAIPLDDLDHAHLQSPPQPNSWPAAGNRPSGTSSSSSPTS